MLDCVLSLPVTRKNHTDGYKNRSNKNKKLILETRIIIRNVKGKAPPTFKIGEDALRHFNIEQLADVNSKAVNCGD